MENVHLNVPMNDLMKRRGSHSVTLALSNRVFVNRSLQLSKIKFFGFDMDYTLAGYKTPAFEQMAFELVIERLISIGYPEELRKFEYTPHFPVRGLWFDMEYGNLLKVDAYGNILVGVHGFHYMNPSEIELFYPNKFLHLNEARVYVLNTLFNLPETYILACMVDFYDGHKDYVRLPDRTAVACGDVQITYRSIFRDVRAAVDWIHIEGPMKARTVENLDKYVMRDDRMAQLLTRMRTHAKTFLLTNSGYQYTKDIMSFMLGDSWTDYFDYVIVDSRKPLWFAEGTVFREVDTSTGALKIGMHTGHFKSGGVYSGGSCSMFTKMVKARGKDVLYIGDHIFGDVLRSKKSRGWRTFLVVPELDQELKVWAQDYPLFQKLQTLDVIMGEMYKDMDSSSTVVPNIRKVTQAVREVTHQMDQSYGMLGSLFRSGSRTTFFASQAARYADLYSSSCSNLLYYPFTYFFRAPPVLFPHEATVGGVLSGSQHSLNTVAESLELYNELSNHDQSTQNSTEKIQQNGEISTKSSVASFGAADDSQEKDVTPPYDANRNTRARTPRRPTFVHEDDRDDDREASSEPTSCHSDENEPAAPKKKVANDDSHEDSPLARDAMLRKQSEFELERLVSVTSSEDVVVMPRATIDPEN